jgi:hypothetical protein
MLHLLLDIALGFTISFAITIVGMVLDDPIRKRFRS